MSEDPYWEISQIAADPDMHGRIVACAQKEGVPDADNWVWNHSWEYAAQPGWGAAWASALAASNPTPGRDAAVISDGQILSATQALQGGGA